MTVNDQQRAAWNGDSGVRWVADADRRDHVLAPVADALFESAALVSGMSLLDVGCGCGATTLQASDAIAPGRAVGIDLSAPMLEVARNRAGDRVVDFIQADAQTDPIDPGGFDAVISRFGTMFFDDPVAAFVNVRSATRPGGVMCIATWQPLGANNWLTIPGATLLRYGKLPEAASGGTGPGMFSQSESDPIAASLTTAGWTHVDVAAVTVTLRLGSNAEEATDCLADTGVARAVLETIEPARRDEAIAAVRDDLVQYERGDGVCLDAGILITRALA